MHSRILYWKKIFCNLTGQRSGPGFDGVGAADHSRVRVPSQPISGYYPLTPTPRSPADHTQKACYIRPLIAKLRVYARKRQTKFMIDLIGAISLGHL